MSFYLYSVNNAQNYLQRLNWFNYPLMIPPYFPSSSYQLFPQIHNSQNRINENLLDKLNQVQTKIFETKENIQVNEKIQEQEESDIYQKKKSLRKSKNIQKQLQSAKKNCESNLVNQFLSYFSSLANSSSIVMGSLHRMNQEHQNKSVKQLQNIGNFFCKMVQIVNSRRERKYVNKAFLQNYFSVSKLQNYMPDILQKVQKFQNITKEEFCQLFRRCCFQFFRSISLSSAVSSAKLNEISRPQHIKRRRLIVETFRKF